MFRILKSGMPYVNIHIAHQVEEIESMVRYLEHLKHHGILNAELASQNERVISAFDCLADYGRDVLAARLLAVLAD